MYPNNVNARYEVTVRRYTHALFAETCPRQGVLSWPTGGRMFHSTLAYGQTLCEYIDLAGE
jgi:hypothetical protein